MIGLFFMLILLALPAHADDAGVGDGIVSVLTAPVDAAIDVAFQAVGYHDDDDGADDDGGEDDDDDD